jgi:hypothetical protein
MPTEDQMASIDTTRNDSAAAQSEDDRVLSWRHAALLAAGYERYAFELALSTEVDLHLAVRLRERGCPADTAARILL